MAGLEQQIGALIARVDGLNHRFDDEREVNRERHQENRETLSEIRTEVRKTNGRVTELERKALHVVPRVDGGRIESTVTRRDVSMVCLGGGGLVACWKFAEWAFHLMKAAGQ